MLMADARTRSDSEIRVVNAQWYSYDYVERSRIDGLSSEMKS